MHAPHTPSALGGHDDFERQPRTPSNYGGNSYDDLNEYESMGHDQHGTGLGLENAYPYELGVPAGCVVSVNGQEAVVRTWQSGAYTVELEDGREETVNQVDVIPIPEREINIAVMVWRGPHKNRIGHLVGVDAGEACVQTDTDDMIMTPLENVARYRG
jgi:hypothetical protein